jgi:hypothetical protein
MAASLFDVLCPLPSRVKRSRAWLGLSRRRDTTPLSLSLLSSESVVAEVEAEAESSSSASSSSEGRWVVDVSSVSSGVS